MAAYFNAANKQAFVSLLMGRVDDRPGFNPFSKFSAKPAHAVGAYLPAFREITGFFKPPDCGAR